MTENSKKDDKVLYYYCSTNVFLSVINNQTLWLSDVTKSNDGLELSGYINLLLDALQKAMFKNSSIPYDKVVTALKSKMWNYYCLAICFTDQDDVVSQWQAYGDDGKGFAIGMSVSALKQICSTHPLFKLSDVVYFSNDRNDKSITKDIDEQIQALSKICNSVEYDTKIDIDKAISHWAGNVILTSAAFHKLKCFCGERETRLCYLRYIYENQYSELKPSSMLNNVRFRSTRTAIIPYLALDISEYKNIFSELVIGPCNTSDIGAIRLLLAKQGFSCCSVRKSQSYYVSRN